MKECERKYDTVQHDVVCDNVQENKRHELSEQTSLALLNFLCAPLLPHLISRLLTLLL